MAELKRNWTLNQNAFRQFLTWLDAGVDSRGKSYLEMRRRLVLYFNRKNCKTPDDMADETLNRVARKLEEKGQIHRWVRPPLLIPTNWDCLILYERHRFPSSTQRIRPIG